MARVNRITIGRLYNLGNYEHVRYDVSVEIADGEDVAGVLENLQNIIAGLKPSRLPDVDLKSSPMPRKNGTKKIDINLLANVTCLGLGSPPFRQARPPTGKA